MLWITGDSGPLTRDNPGPRPGVHRYLWILGTNR
jgi:hypothetical protein